MGPRGRIPAPKLNVVRAELACGAVLLVDRRPGAPVTGVKFHQRGGHSLDPVGFEGTAHLTGGLARSGHRQPYGGRDRPRCSSRRVAVFTATRSGLSGAIASDAWKLLAQLMCELVLEPRFPAQKIARQKQRSTRSFVD